MTIKSIPDQLYHQLKERAAAHRRSLNSEVIICLEQAIAGSVPDAGVTLAKADALRAKLRVPRLTEARLRAAKAAGRP
ncbi:MAG: FitA-like ribbon-helix-helix domain-containing protein [Gemmatimonadaceae bacterium]